MAPKSNSLAIKKLWRDHCEVRFPEGLAGQDVAGICVASLDTIVAGCIQTFVSHGGRLENDKVALLTTCHRSLSIIVKELTGEAKEYFTRLETLARLALDTIRDEA